jgi:hypothetical protein
VKKIFKLLTDYIKEKTFALSNVYKTERRKRFPKEYRFARMPEYFKATVENISQLQNSIMQLQHEQTQLMASFGLTQNKLAQFGPQLAPLMNELLLSQDVSVDDVRAFLALKA